jgi:hypothetical protein
MRCDVLRDRFGGSWRAAVVAIACLIPASPVWADDKPAADPAKKQTPEITKASDTRRPWSVFYYHSQMTDNSVWEVLENRDVVFRFGSLDTIDFEYELQRNNLLRKIFRPLLSTIEVGAAATKHNDPGANGFEIAPYIMFRWRNLPLKRFLIMSIGVGEGVSYVTEIPTREMEGKGKRFLDFMALEATFALPAHPQIEIVPRIHHRSSAWSLFGDSVSSNALGLGLRYRF